MLDEHKRNIAQSWLKHFSNLENETALPGESKPYFYFGYENGKPMLNVVEHGTAGDRTYRGLRREDQLRRCPINIGGGGLHAPAKL